MKKNNVGNWGFIRVVSALMCGMIIISGSGVYPQQVRAEGIAEEKEPRSYSQEDYDFYYYGSGGIIEEAGVDNEPAISSKAIAKYGSSLVAGDELTVASVEPLTTSDAGVELIKGYEGCLLRAYDDMQSNVVLTADTIVKGTLTIGYGHTGLVDGLPISWDLTITQEKAEELLRADLAVFENAINIMASNHNIVFTQNQFDALVSFTYNVGYAWTMENRSATIKTYIFNGISNYSAEQIVYAFSLWNTSGGIVLPGLTRRRRAEAAYFLGNPEAATYVAGQYTVSATSLDVRTGPGLTYAKVKTDTGYLSYAKDTVVTITAIDATYWGQCSDGWIQLDYTRFVVGTAADVTAEEQIPVVEEPLYPAGYYVVTAQSLNVRSSAEKVSNNIVKVLKAGTAVKISEVVGKWGKMSQGWISLDYCQSITLGVTSFSSIKNTDAGIVINWQKVEGVAGYIVYRYSEDTWKKIKTITSADTLTYTDSGRKEGSCCRYTVCTYVEVEGEKVTGELCGEGVIYRLTPPTVKTLTSTVKKQFVLTWKKNSKASGYEISYSTNKKMTGAKKHIMDSGSKVKKTIKNLKSGKKYYVRIRTFKTVDDITYYSGWCQKYQIKMK